MPDFTEHRSVSGCGLSTLTLLSVMLTHQLAGEEPTGTTGEELAQTGPEGPHT